MENKDQLALCPFCLAEIQEPVFQINEGFGSIPFAYCKSCGRRIQVASAKFAGILMSSEDRRLQTSIATSFLDRNPLNRIWSAEEGWISISLIERLFSLDDERAFRPYVPYRDRLIFPSSDSLYAAKASLYSIACHGVFALYDPSTALVEALIATSKEPGQYSDRGSYVPAEPWRPRADIARLIEENYAKPKGAELLPTGFIREAKASKRCPVCLGKISWPPWKKNTFCSSCGRVFAE